MNRAGRKSDLALGLRVEPEDRCGILAQQQE
jgi:hypothetical protein